MGSGEHIDSGAVRGLVPPKQRRSKATAEKILRTADQLVKERPFNELTVQDICNAADVSSSSFYARFATKEDVLLALFDLHAETAKAETATAVAAALAQPGEPSELVELLLRHFLTFVQRNNPLMASIFADPSLTDHYWALSHDISGSLTDLLADQFGVGSPKFRLQAEFAVRVAAATIQRAKGLPTRFGDRMGLSDEELVRELTLMVMAYLEAAATASEAL